MLCTHTEQYVVANLRMQLTRTRTCTSTSAKKMHNTFPNSKTQTLQREKFTKMTSRVFDTHVNPERTTAKSYTCTPVHVYPTLFKS